jgi:hypothetical protein
MIFLLFHKLYRFGMLHKHRICTWIGCTKALEFFAVI